MLNPRLANASGRFIVRSVAENPFPHDRPIQLHGQLLLADPSLRGSSFHRSVVLVAEHAADQGAFGLILNHPLGKSVGDFLEGDEFSPLQKLEVYDGGPVGHDQLTFSSFWWNQQSGLRWALRLSVEDAIDHAHRSGRVVRAFVGYSGWTAGQLEHELRRNSWVTAPASADLLGRSHDLNLWAGLMREVSPLHRILADSPEDPTLN